MNGLVPIIKSWYTKPVNIRWGLPATKKNTKESLEELYNDPGKLEIMLIQTRR